VLVDDQIPITAAPNEAKTSDSPPAPARNMRNAIVAKKSGQRTPSSPSKDERIIIFRWSANPRPRTRATRNDERVPVGAGSLSAIRRDRLLGDERDVRVLEGRLARRDAAERDAVEASEHLVGRLAARLGLDDDDLRLVAVLDGDRRDAVDLASDSTLPFSMPYTSISTTTPSDTCSLRSRGVPSATIFPRATTAMRSQSASASNM
jgi:hypothetical protein